MSRFLTLRADSGPRGFGFVDLGVEFGPLGLGDDFDLFESNLGLWDSIIGIRNRFWAHGSRFLAFDIPVLTSGSRFWEAESQFGHLEIDFWPLKVDFFLWERRIWALIVDLRPR